VLGAGAGVIRTGLNQGEWGKRKRRRVQNWYSVAELSGNWVASGTMAGEKGRCKSDARQVGGGRALPFAVVSIGGIWTGHTEVEAKLGANVSVGIG